MAGRALRLVALQAQVPRERLVDVRLDERVATGLRERRLAQLRHRSPVAPVTLDPRQLLEGPGPDRTLRRRGRGVAEQPVGPRPVAREPGEPGRVDRALEALFPGGGRGQGARLLGQLRGCLPGTASRHRLRRLRKCGRDGLVGPLRRQREMARPLLRLLDQGGERPVRPAPPFRSGAVDDGRGEQRMQEPNVLAVDPHDSSLHGQVQRGQRVGRAGRLQQRDGRPPDQGRGQQHRAGLRWQVRQPLSHEGAQLIRYGQRFSRDIGVALQGTSQLEPIERVARRGLVDAAERRPREERSQAVADEPLERGQAERADIDAGHSQAGRRTVQSECGRRARLGPLGEQEVDSLSPSLRNA